MVLSIIGILSAVVVTSQASFNKTVLLSNTAYDVALAIRSAETYGLGSRVAASGVTNAGYGIHIDASQPSKVLLFADVFSEADVVECHPQGTEVASPDHIPGDCAYTAGKDIDVMPLALGNGMKVSSLSVFTNNAWGSDRDSLDMVFARPNTEVYFATNGEYVPNVSAACITITSPQGGARYVRVERTGNIIVNATSC